MSLRDVFLRFFTFEIRFRKLSIVCQFVLQIGIYTKIYFQMLKIGAATYPISFPFQ